MRSRKKARGCTPEPSGRTSKPEEEDYGSSDHLPDATPGNIQEEGFIDAFYQPRSVSALALLVGFVVYVTIWREQEVFQAENRLKRGLLLAGAAFLLYCMIQLRDGHLLRPHPGVWRIVHGMGLLYFLILVFLLAQDFNGVQAFLKLFDQDVGVLEEEHSYGSDCRIYIDDDGNPFQNIFDQFFDRFTVAHLLGWTVKALILRDWGLMWVASVLFEVLEVTFQHMYANFNECWWDHLILDIFGCNLAGMCIGMVIVSYLGTHEFNWTGQRVGNIRGYAGKMKRVVLQFTPRTFEVYHWQMFDSWRRFCVAVSVLFVLLLGEMNGFFLKSTFNIPIKSDINLYRLFFWVFLTYMATFEFNRFAEGKSRRIGVNSWLATSLVSFETLLVVKHTYQQNLFKRNELIPARYIVNGYLATLVILMVVIMVSILRWLVVELAGAKEENLREKKAIKTRVRSASIESIEAASPGASFYIRAAIVLNNVFRVLTFMIPIPLLIVLLIDCYRTFWFHPPPVPGKYPGW